MSCGFHCFGEYLLAPLKSITHNTSYATTCNHLQPSATIISWSVILPIYPQEPIYEILKQQKLEKTKKKNKVSRTTLDSGLVVKSCFFWVSRVFFWFSTRKQKKIKNLTTTPESRVVLETLFFSRGFCYFWSKTKKTSRKPKKNKDLTTSPESRAVLETLLFFCFFWFSSFCCFRINLE